MGGGEDIGWTFNATMLAVGSNKAFKTVPVFPEPRSPNLTKSLLLMDIPSELLDESSLDTP